MKTNIIAILVNHTKETYHVMEDQTEILDIIMFNNFGDITANFGDMFAQYIKWENDQEITLESYRSNSNDHRSEVRTRIDDLMACGYTGL